MLEWEKLPSINEEFQTIGCNHSVPYLSFVLLQLPHPRKINKYKKDNLTLNRQQRAELK